MESMAPNSGESIRSPSAARPIDTPVCGTSAFAHGGFIARQNRSDCRAYVLAGNAHKKVYNAGDTRRGQCRDVQLHSGDDEEKRQHRRRETVNRLEQQFFLWGDIGMYHTQRHACQQR